MAITINTSPSGSPSAHDALWHVCSSTASGTTDMKYVFDVYVGGTQLVRVKQFPEPSNGKAYFDASPIIRNEFTFEWFEPTNTSAYVAEPNISGQIAVVYNLRVGEEVSGVTTLNMASGNVSGFNWSPNLFKRRVDGLNTKLNKWLTNRPLYANAALGENLFAGFYTNANLILKCQRFDASNNSIGSILSGTTTVIENGFVQLNIGTTALGTYFGIDFNDSVKYYDVWFNSLDKLRVYLTCNPKYTNIPIHFLNRWGLFDSHRFDLVSKLSMDIDRKSFTERDYKFNGNSVDYISTNNVYYGGKINYSNSATWTYKLNSTPLDDAEWVWIADLMQSPQILLEYDGYFYPVTIKRTTYEYNKHVVDRLKPLEIEFELNTSRYTQLR